MSTEPRQVPVSPSPDAAGRRLNIHGIKEMPAGYDAEVAELFRDLRAASTLTETDLAQKLSTRIEVVQALEQGALYALPPWPETCRVVNGYGALLNLDIRPLLRRIYSQLEAGIVELSPKPIPDVPTMNPPGNANFASDAGRQPPPPPPQPQAMPQVAWPNMPQPVPQAQNPWANASPPQQNQRTAAPAAPRAQPQPSWAEANPGQAMPQAARQQQPRPAQTQAPPPQPQRVPPPPPQPDLQAAPPPPPELAVPELEADRPRRKSPLLKWGLVAFVVSVLAFGTWFVLGDLTGPLKSMSTGNDSSEPVLDPDDPRSRKSDRLPNAF